MALCHDGEGWQPISRLRPFDFTRCFEEGFLLSPLLLLFILSSSIGVFRLVKADRKERSLKSIWLLRAKLVRIIFTDNLLFT